MIRKGRINIITMDRNYQEIEKKLKEIQSIISCRFVLGQADRINELHIISNGTRNPKRISRDIQSTLIVMYDLDIDYKKISIVEIPEKDIKELKTRFKIEKISHDNYGMKASISVILSKDGIIYKNELKGINTSRNIKTMLVNSTLKNIEESYNRDDIFILEDVKSIEMSSDEIIVVIIIHLINGHENYLSGSAIVQNDQKEAVVKATLDAVNQLNI